MKADGAIADAVPNGTVSFDLTHGFRHLGMLGFLSAFMLERVRNLTVRDLWYGAHDMKRDNITPVLRLDGLVRVRRWGYERIRNVPDAARQIRTFLPVLDEPLSGASGLFQRKLGERLQWAKHSGLAEQQRKLAYQYLNRRDFVRAAMLAREAWVSRLCSQRDRAVDYGDRQVAVEEFEASLRRGDHPQTLRDAYWTITHLRNALAHGTRPERRYQTMLKDPDRLFRELEAALKRLLG